MASGSSGRGSKGFDFGSDDILSSYEDYAGNNQDSSNGTHNDPSKDFHKSRMARTSVFPATAHNSSEDSLSQDVIATVEMSMKKYADNLMRFLEGISSRLSKLELYCYNLDKSIGEMRSDLNSDHGEADSKLKSLEKHLQEVHRSLQILRDKQELAETQKELAKLQLVQKESSSSSHSQSNEERSSPSATDPKRTVNASDTNNQQLALALPHQVAPQPLPGAPPSQAPAPIMTQAAQQPPYYMQPPPLPNLPAVAQLPQNQYLPSDPHYRIPQPTSSQVTQSPSVQQFSQYQQLHQPQQQWPQQLPQQVHPRQPPSMQSQTRPPSTNVYSPYPPSQATNPSPTETLPPSMQSQTRLPSTNVYSPYPPSQATNPSPTETLPPSMQSQTRPPSSNVYSPYPPSQATNPSPTETLPNSMPMQMPYSGIPPPGSSRGDAIPYGYGGTGRTIPQQLPPQQIKSSFPAQPGDVYGTSGTHASLPPASAYMVYDGEGGRTHHPPQPHHFAQAGYPPTSASLQNPAPHNLMIRNPSQSQFIRSHPYNDLIEKLVSMGFRGDHVASVIQRMEESGQPIDFNSLLDRLNVHSSVAPQRGWSG